ncbi:MAG: hypothetical protein A3G34_05695 [Candidatus Lindowbacteria bacterium RIFCSPLOWO2_12_FULL_62_27]|nr:MAG: hypothetical protein A3I06_13360 [Candidatus Lindowbacteria bacterium RIFCSPLOWO2_02_FULL_62_12]OGH59914.1 MAG: hypothetical protein A3G34_05695 [Candidatus Lindowbacteria bacterium RIFCSPLOWO2_12_FULL_62_27]
MYISLYIAVKTVLQASCSWFIRDMRVILIADMGRGGMFFRGVTGHFSYLTIGTWPPSFDIFTETLLKPVWFGGQWITAGVPTVFTAVTMRPRMSNWFACQDLKGNGARIDTRT